MSLSPETNPIPLWCCKCKFIRENHITWEVTVRTIQRAGNQHRLSDEPSSSLPYWRPPPSQPDIMHAWADIPTLLAPPYTHTHHRHPLPPAPFPLYTGHHGVGRRLQPIYMMFQVKMKIRTKSAGLLDSTCDASYRIGRVQTYTKL